LETQVWSCPPLAAPAAEAPAQQQQPHPQQHQQQQQVKTAVAAPAALEILADRALPPQSGAAEAVAVRAAPAAGAARPAAAAPKTKHSTVLMALGLLAILTLLLVVGFLLAENVGQGGSPRHSLRGTGHAPTSDAPQPTTAGSRGGDGGASANTTTTTTAALPAMTAVGDRGDSKSSTTIATSTTPGASTSTSSSGQPECYDLYSEMNVNPLHQRYPDNPDSNAYGFTTCKLCTNGTMHCTSLLHSGKSELVASHIHLASDEHGSTGEGPPVINFCGKDTAGLIRDGTAYTQECEPWDSSDVSHNVNVPGVVVPNSGMTAAERVEDIARQPNKYYFNFHSLASWSHWYPQPHGICRGVLRLQTSGR
jgi:hypothetical protein